MLDVMESVLILPSDVFLPEPVHGQLPEVERHHVQRLGVLPLDVRRRVGEVAREEPPRNGLALHFAMARVSGAVSPRPSQATTSIRARPAPCRHQPLSPRRNGPHGSRLAAADRT